MDPGTQAVPVATGKGHDADKSVDQHDQLLPVSGTDASDFTTQAFFAGRDRKARNRAEGRARTSISAESDGRFDVVRLVHCGSAV